MKSVFLTGASGTGKSTTYRRLINEGFIPSPNHLTRERRDNEVEAIDAHFLSVERFAANMAVGLYLESSMEEAEYGGTYYGSPATWQTDASQGVKFVAIPSNAATLRVLLQRLDDQGERDQVVWANLHAPLDTRRKRVAAYITDEAQLHNRLYNGLGQGIKPDADVNIDTNIHEPDQVHEIITSLTKKF